MRCSRSFCLLAALALLVTALPCFAAGTPGDPILLPDYIQTTHYYDPPATVSNPFWSTTLDLTATGDDAADRAYTPGTELQDAYVTLEHSGSQGISASELWLLSVSGEMFVGILGDSSLGWRREHWALSPNARTAIRQYPASFEVRFFEPLSGGDDDLRLRMVRLSGNCAATSVTPEPGGLVLLLSGAAVVLPVAVLRRRKAA
jgi:hypothetical protein